jgi:proteic killer suppression protein
VIKTFRDAETERLWKEERVTAHPGQSSEGALKKLQLLNAAGALGDLAVPPGNRLERLRGYREGQYSIRVNDQYRICFKWKDGNAYEVEVVDYH